jgi:hypothetical protein
LLFFCSFSREGPGSRPSVQDRRRAGDRSPGHGDPAVSAWTMTGIMKPFPRRTTPSAGPGAAGCSPAASAVQDRPAAAREPRLRSRYTTPAMRQGPIPDLPFFVDRSIKYRYYLVRDSDPGRKACGCQKSACSVIRGDGQGQRCGIIAIGVLAPAVSGSRPSRSRPGHGEPCPGRSPLKPGRKSLESGDSRSPRWALASCAAIPITRRSCSHDQCPGARSARRPISSRRKTRPSCSSITGPLSWPRSARADRLPKG